MFQLIAQSIAGILAGVVLSSSSCITVIDTPSPGGNGNGDGNGTSETLRIVLVNETPWAVDPQFFTTAAALGDPEQMLFLAVNQVTSFGFAGGGLIPGGESDEVTLDCENAITIGTRGGRFLNPDTGALLGTGQQRVAGIQLSYNCGDVITLRYRAEGQAFSTSLQVE